MRHRPVQLIGNGSVNVACGCPYRRIHGRLRHPDHLRKTALDQFSLSLPLGLVLRRFSLQPSDDAFQQALNIAVKHLILLLYSWFTAANKWFVDHGCLCISLSGLRLVNVHRTEHLAGWMVLSGRSIVFPGADASPTQICEPSL